MNSLWYKADWSKHVAIAHAIIKILSSYKRQSRCSLFDHHSIPISITATSKCLVYNLHLFVSYSTGCIKCTPPLIPFAGIRLNRAGNGMVTPQVWDWQQKINLLSFHRAQVAIRTNLEAMHRSHTEPISFRGQRSLQVYTAQ